MEFIEIHQAFKSYKEKTVLNQVSFRVEKGQFIALLGPSGCGKTTLLNAIAGLIDIDGGSIHLSGEVLSKKGYTMRPEDRNIGVVFQDFALWPHMTVYDNIAFGLRMKKEKKPMINQRIQEVLHMVQMSGYEKYFPHQLSGGQKQRIAIARALAPRPTVLLMDEPLSSLDAKLREEMRWELLRMIQEIGITTIYVTHDQTEALTMADHLILLNQGRLEQQGSPSEVYHSPSSVFSATFLGASNVLEGISEVHEGGYCIQCSGVRLPVMQPIETGVGFTAVIRPQYIHILGANDSHPSGLLLDGRIKQRAFQGNTWQYKVELLNSPEIVLEAWDLLSYDIGDSVKLSIEQDRVLHFKSFGEERI